MLRFAKKRKWLLIAVSATVMAMLMAVLLPISLMMRISLSGDFLFFGIEGHKVLAAASITSLGHNQDKAATSPWTALSSLSLSADDYIIVCEAADAGSSSVQTILDNVVEESQEDSNTAYQFYGERIRSQSFTATSDYSLKGVSLELQAFGADYGDLYIDVYEENGSGIPTGGSLASGSILIPVTGTFEWYNIEFNSPCSVTDTDVYCIVASLPGGDQDNCLAWNMSESNPYAGGVLAYSSDNGDNWYLYTDKDFTFKTLSLVGDTINLNADATGNNAGQAVAKIWSGQVSVTGDAYYIVVTNTSTAKGITAYAVSGLADSAFDKSNSATGSGEDANTDVTSLLSQDSEVCIAVSAVEDEVDDPHGSWTEGAGYVSGNEQFDATDGSGDNSNMQVHSVAMAVSDGTSQAYRGEDAGHQSNDWAAAIATYKVLSGASIDNSPSEKNYGTVAKNASYWSNGSEPSWPLADDDAFFTITNDGSVTIDIYISSTDFDGGGGWNLVTAAPGAAEARMLAFKEGDGNTDNITIINTQTLFIEGLESEDDIDWEIRLDVPTESDSATHSAEITLEASAS